jgi:hypothetical protein
VGARVGRSITLSSSQTHNHSITRGSLNQGDPSMAHADGKAVMGPNRDFRKGLCRDCRKGDEVTDVFSPNGKAKSR